MAGFRYHAARACSHVTTELRRWLLHISTALLMLFIVYFFRISLFDDYINTYMMALAQAIDAVFLYREADFYFLALLRAMLILI